jgi:hypothetical protein
VSESYIAEKLWAAVDMLDSDRGDLRGRLTSAAVHALIRLNPDDFSDRVDRATFENLMLQLRRFEAVGHEGDIAASAQLLTGDEAEQVATTIRKLHAMERAAASVGQTTGQFVREAVVLRCALAAGEVTDEMQAIAAKLRES